jgi:hypothetical protein
MGIQAGRAAPCKSVISSCKTLGVNFAQGHLLESQPQSYRSRQDAA